MPGSPPFSQEDAKKGEALHVTSLPISELRKKMVVMVATLVRGIVELTNVPEGTKYYP